MITRYSNPGCRSYMSQKLPTNPPAPRMQIRFIKRFETLLNILQSSGLGLDMQPQFVAGPSVHPGRSQQPALPIGWRESSRRSERENNPHTFEEFRASWSSWMRTSATRTKRWGGLVNRAENRP